MNDEFLKKYVEEEELHKYFYTDDGRLVQLIETISNDKHIVSYANYYEQYSWDGENSYTGIDYSDEIIYRGNLFKYDSYVKNAIEHDHNKTLETRRTKLNEEIKELEKQKNELQMFQKNNAKQLEANKVFQVAFDLMTNTKRFVFIRESSCNYYIIDNKNKRVIPDQTEDEYYRDTSRYKDVKFTFFRDLSGYGNIGNGNFNYSVELDRESGNGSYSNSFKYISNNDFKTEVHFFDTFDELQVLIDDMLLKDELSPRSYLEIVNQYKLKINVEAIKKFKDKIIETVKNEQTNLKKQQQETVEKMTNVATRILNYENIDLSDVKSLIKVIRDERIY